MEFKVFDRDAASRPYMGKSLDSMGLSGYIKIRPIAEIPAEYRGISERQRFIICEKNCLQFFMSRIVGHQSILQAKKTANSQSLTVCNRMT